MDEWLHIYVAMRASIAPMSVPFLVQEISLWSLHLELKRASAAISSLERCVGHMRQRTHFMPLKKTKTINRIECSHGYISLCNVSVGAV